MGSQIFLIVILLTIWIVHALSHTEHREAASRSSRAVLESPYDFTQDYSTTRDWDYLSKQVIDDEFDKTYHALDRREFAFYYIVYQRILPTLRS